MHVLKAKSNLNASIWKTKLTGAKKSGDGTYGKGAGPYDGQWKDDYRHGMGTQLWDCGALIGCMYEGVWKRGQANGEGKLTHVDGSTFEGMVSWG